MFKSKWNMTLIAILFVIAISAFVLVISGKDAFDTLMIMAMPTVVAFLAVYKGDETSSNIKEVKQRLNGSLDTRIQKNMAIVLKHQDKERNES